MSKNHTILYMLELCHLGDDCAPGIIINDILKQKEKHLFMLGVYRFNDILLYLENCNYEKIYDNDDLIILPNNHVKHIKYNFVFNHDYKITNSQINNYDNIRDRFNKKINTFRQIITSENMCVFIVFTKEIENLKISNMLNFLSNNKKFFHIMIFTSKKNNISNSHCCSIINLKNNYEHWYKMDETCKKTLYEEIYEKFIDCLKVCNINHNFPSKIPI
jgi:hypothetical protein